jgi:hypothetical protein
MGSYEMFTKIWSEPDTAELPVDMKGVKDLQRVDLLKVVAVHEASEKQPYARVQVGGGNYLPMAPSLYEPVKNRWLDFIQHRAYEQGLTYKLELTGGGVAVTHVVGINEKISITDSVEAEEHDVNDEDGRSI